MKETRLDVRRLLGFRLVTVFVKDGRVALANAARIGDKQGRKFVGR